MSLFKNQNKKLLPVKEKRVNLEKDIQELTEKNLDTIFGYTLVSSELKIENFRFDTFAWDSENNAFIIIEYKKDRNFSIVDQGFAYLSTLLNRKADFILEYNTKFPNRQLKKEDLDWSQTRIVFISSFFTNYQKNSINFKDMAFDLYEFKIFENSIVAYNKVQANNPAESINLITKNSNVKKVTKEIKSYTVDDHFKPDWTESRELFEILHEKLLELDPNLLCSPQKSYIGYKLENKVVFQLVVYKSKLALQLCRVKPEDLRDPENKATYEKNSYKFYSKHVTTFKIAKSEDIDYAIMLAKQVYKKFVEEN